MIEMKKIFAVSDIHGALIPFREALLAAGFDIHNDSHLLVCCGDLFDENGDNDELCEFLDGLKHKILILGDGDEALRERADLPQNVQKLLSVMKNYFETKRYIFVHGWIPEKSDFESNDSWKKARSVGWNEFYGENTTIPEKTIVCGHIPTRAAYAFDSDWELSSCGIYHGESMIAIRSGAEIWGKINVLTLEERMAL
jgi:predicted phosphodiesterase